MKFSTLFCLHKQRVSDPTNFSHTLLLFLIVSLSCTTQLPVTAVYLPFINFIFSVDYRIKFHLGIVIFGIGLGFTDQRIIHYFTFSRTVTCLEVICRKQTCEVPT